MKSMHVRYLIYIIQEFVLLSFFWVKAIKFNEGKEIFAFLFLNVYHDVVVQVFVYNLYFYITYSAYVLKKLKILKVAR